MLKQALMAAAICAAIGGAMAEPSTTSFTLATYNIHIGVPMGKDIGVHTSTTGDLDNIADVLAESGADIVALQEVDCEYGLSIPDRRRSSLINQARYLAAASGYYYVFGSAQDDTGYPTDNGNYLEWGHPDRWTNNGMPHGEVGNGILSRWPFASTPENILLPKDEGQERRACIRAEISIPTADGETSTPVVIYATHLQHNNAATRYKQMAVILERAAAEPSDNLVFIIGDLNQQLDAAEEHNPVRLALDKGFHDLAAPAEGADPLAFATYPANDPTRRIDFILANQPLHVVRAQVINTQSSDHRPVTVTVTPRS